MSAPDEERAALEARIHAAWAARDFEAAATAAIVGYGPEVLRYLMSLARDATAANDAFSLFCENVWSALPTFRDEATFRVWCYALARFAWSRVLRDPHRRADRRVPLSSVPSVELAAAEARARTAEYLRTDTKERIEALRASLAPDDQTLLVLRVNRKLAWADIARVLAEPDEVVTPKQVAQRAAALRKRYQRLKDELRAAVAKS